MEPKEFAPPDRPEPTPQAWTCPICGYGEYKNREDWQFRVFRHIGEYHPASARHVAVPARAHQEEKEQEGVSRVDGVPGVGQGDLPRKSPTGDPRRCDELLKNLRGSCAFGGTCGTTRERREFCTLCEAAARLEEADEALRLIVCECECWQADACSQSVVGRSEAARAALAGRR